MANWQGRKEEIADLKQWLNNQNISLIGIEGIGGTGKSMLAAKIYEDETIENFPKRFWADITYGAIFTDVATEVLVKFGFRVPEQEAQLVPALVKCLQSGEYLLIIDNLESLLTTDGLWGSQFYQEFFTTWVECGGTSKVIVTTRERPELPKRFQWLPLSGLKIADGVALLTSLGIQGNLEEFVKLVDGYPLLLQFVADLLKAEYPQDPNLKRLASLGLGNLQQLLTDKKVVGVHRRENVAMVLVLDASFERLSDFQKSLLQNISVYRGAVNAKAAMAVCPGNSETEIETELRNLVRRSFLSEKLIDDCRWFEFQPVVLEYVRYQAGDPTEAHQKAINYYRSIAKQSGWQTKDDIQEYLEIFYHFYQLADYDSAFEAIWHCNDFLTLRGYYANKVELYEQLVIKWAEIDDRQNRNYRTSLTLLGNACHELSQYERAIAFHQQSLNIKKEIGDIQGESNSLNNLGNAYDSLGQYERAIDFYHKSLYIFRQIGDIQGESNSLNGLGNAYKSLGQYERAIDFYQQSLNIDQEIGNIQGKSASLNNLGCVYKSLGKYQQAITFYQQSLNIDQEIGDINGEGFCLNNLGNVYLKLSQYQQAIELFQKSLDIFRKIGDINSEGNSLVGLGIAYKNLREYQQAIDFYQQSLDIFRKIGDINGESICFYNLGNAFNILGKYERAIDFFQQSLDIKREIGDINSEGNCLINLGIAYKSLRKYQQAIDFYQQSLDIFRKIGDLNSVITCSIALGDAYKSLGQYERAIDFYQQSLDIFRQIGDVGGESIFLNNLGNAYNSLGQYERAIAFFQQSLDIAKEIGDIQGESSSLGNLGNAYNSLGQYERAITFYQQSLDIFRQIGDVQGESRSLNNLGGAYNSLGQYERAIAFFQQSLDIFRQIGDVQGESASLTGLGIASDSLGQYQQAIEFYQQSLDIKRKIGDRNGEALCLQNLGNTYSKCGKIKEGFAASYQAQIIRQELGVSMFYPQWMKSLINFAQRGYLQLILCFIFGLIAFPFALVWIILLSLWRVIRANFRTFQR